MPIGYKILNDFDKKSIADKKEYLILNPHCFVGKVYENREGNEGQRMIDYVPQRKKS